MGFEPSLLAAVAERNRQQKSVLFAKLAGYFNSDLHGRRIAVWGLAFKPGTDDMREAPSIALIHALMDAGAQVRACDPQAVPAARRLFPASWQRSGQLRLEEDPYAVLEGADALVLVTEWKRFRQPDLGKMSALMAGCVIVDGRNQYDPAALRRSGFDYLGIGRSNVSALVGPARYPAPAMTVRGPVASLE